jgi:hypothetical protein
MAEWDIIKMPVVGAGIQSFAFYSNTRQSPIRARMRKMFEGRMRRAPGMHGDAPPPFSVERQSGLWLLVVRLVNVGKFFAVLVVDRCCWRRLLSIYAAIVGLSRIRCGEPA